MPPSAAADPPLRTLALTRSTRAPQSGFASELVSSCNSPLERYLRCVPPLRLGGVAGQATGRRSCGKRKDATADSGGSASAV
eukprot:3948464-Pyramimonas_sp.AAC.1